AIGNLVELRGRLDPPVKADAREIDAVAMRLVDVDQGLEFVSPDQHLAARPPRRDGKRRPPRARADDADRLQRHAGSRLIAVGSHTGSRPASSFRRKPESRVTMEETAALDPGSLRDER